MAVYSHTFFRDFDNCAYKAYRKFVVRDLPKPKIEGPMKWGIDVHEAMERRLKRQMPLPDDMKQFEPYALALERSEIPIQAEMKVAVDKDFRPCDFFAGNVYMRGKVDVALVKTTTAYIVDWKTGKKDEDPAELKLHALMLQAKLPRLTQITGAYAWLKTNEMGAPHDLSDTAGTHQQVLHDAAKVEDCQARNFWPKTQNPLCGWCDVLDCNFNRKGKQ